MTCSVLSGVREETTCHLTPDPDPDPDHTALALILTLTLGSSLSLVTVLEHNPPPLGSSLAAPQGSL